MRWVKKPTDTYRGKMHNELLDELGHFGPFAADVLIQMCAEKLQRNKERDINESDCVFTFNERLVRDTLRVSRTKVERMLNLGSTLGLLSFSFVENKIEIKMPKLVYLLNYDSKKKGIKKEQKAHDASLDIDKEIDIDIDKDFRNNTKVLFLPDSEKIRSREKSNASLNFESMTFSDKGKEKFTEFGFTQKQLNSLVDAFEDQQWIESELLKSLAWIESNPQRRPKKFPKFFNNWLQRGWESYRKTLQTNKTVFVAKQKTPEELRAIYGEDVDL